MTDWRASWNRYWFAPQSPDDLALSRIAFFGLLFFLYLPEDFHAWGDVALVFWSPVSFFKWLRLPVLSSGQLATLGLVWKLSLLTCALGLVTRASTWIAFVLGLYLLGLPHNFGKVHHFDAMVVLVFGVLAVSRCGDAWALDRLLGIGKFDRRRSASLPVDDKVAAPEATKKTSTTTMTTKMTKTTTVPAPHGDYRWPIRAIWLALALIFFGAGVSKIRHGGLAWIISDNMAVQFVRHAYQISNEDPASPWLALFLAQYPLVCSFLALGTVVIETGYPAALFNRRARLFFPAAMCGALLGIRLLMGPTFVQFLICHVFWIPWSNLMERVARARAHTNTRRATPSRVPL